MKQARKYLRDNFKITPHQLKKFEEREINQLADIAYQTGLNPQQIIDYRELTEFVLDADAVSQDLLTGQFQDPTSLREYLRNFAEVKDSSQEELKPFRYLGKSYTEYQALKKELESLVLPDDKKDSRIQPTLENFFSEIQMYKPQLNKLSIGGILGGSCYYGDPHSENFDIDFDFVYETDRDNPKYFTGDKGEKKQIFEILKDDLRKHCAQSTDILATNLSRYQKDLTQIKNKEYNYLSEAIGDTAVFLTGQPHYFDFCTPENNRSLKQKINQAYQDIEQLAITNHIFRALIYFHLEKTLAIRHEKN